MSNKTKDHTLVTQNDNQEEEVDNADAESPIHEDPQFSVTTTVADLDRA